MKKSLPLVALLCVLALPFLSGCVAAIGNGQSPRGANVTLGQQLIDLQRARDAGAMTPEEYQAQRAKLLAQK